MSDAAPSTERLPLNTKLAFGCPQLGVTMVGTCCAVHLLFYYSDVIHLNPAHAGLVLFLGAVWDAITDPIMGVFSDTRRWAQGRRRPFFIPGACALAVVFVLLFRPPEELGAAAALVDPEATAAAWNVPLFTYMLATYLLFCTARTVIDVPYSALLPDMSRNYDERTRLAGWRQGMSVIGDIVGALLPTLLIGAIVLERQRYSTSTGIMVVVLLAAVYLGYRGTYERTDATTLPPVPMHPLMVLRAMFHAIGSRPAIVLIVSYAIVAVGQGFGVATFLFVTKYYFHDAGMADTVMMYFFAGALVGIPVWIRATMALTKKHAYQVTVFGYLLCALPILFCRYDDHQLFFFSMFGVGLCNTGIWMVPDAMAPDVIEWQRLHRGQAEEGAFYGMWQFLRKCVTGLSPWIVGETLDYTGFVPDQVQDGRVLLAILALFTIFPLITMSIGMLIFTWYPITREVYHDIMRQLAEREQGAEA